MNVAEAADEVCALHFDAVEPEIAETGERLGRSVVGEKARAQLRVVVQRGAADHGHPRLRQGVAAGAGE